MKTLFKPCARWVGYLEEQATPMRFLVDGTPAKNDPNIDIYAIENFLGRITITADPTPEESAMTPRSFTISARTSNSAYVPCAKVLEKYGQSRVIGNKYVPDFQATPELLSSIPASTLSLVLYNLSYVNSAYTISYSGAALPIDVKRPDYFAVLTLDVGSTVAGIHISSRSTSSEPVGVSIRDEDDNILYETSFTSMAISESYYDNAQRKAAKVVYCVRTTWKKDATVSIPTISMNTDGAPIPYNKYRLFKEYNDFSLLRIARSINYSYIACSHTLGSDRVFIPRPVYAYNFSQYVPPTMITPSIPIYGGVDVL